jgi:hypothetical protein
MFQQPPKPGEPLYITTADMFFSQMRRAKEAHAEAEAKVAEIASTLTRLTDANGQPLQNDKDRVITKLRELLHRYLAEPSHLDAWAELPGAVSPATFIVAYLFTMEYGRPYLKLFPEFANQMTLVPLLTLAELVDPKQPSLLEAYELAFPVTVTHRGTDVKVIGDEGKKAARVRLMGMLAYTLEFLQNKGVLVVVEDTATLNESGLKLLKHLREMDLWIAARHEAAKRLGINLTGVK